MPKFVIGIGSQRAGSTLLHKILDECTSIFMHPLKELHYYDTLYNVRAPSVLTNYSHTQYNREFDRLIDAETHEYIDKRYKCYLRANKLLSEQNVEQLEYLDLYRPCIMGNSRLGEITPEYMILPESGVRQMAEDLGADTQIILITRNPVERFISSVKLLKTYNDISYDIAHLSKDIFEVLDKKPAWVEQQKALNDYQSALKRYEAHFNSVLVLSYEELVRDVESTAHSLAEFLDEEVRPAELRAALSETFNALGATGEISESVKNSIAQRLGIIRR